MKKTILIVVCAIVLIQGIVDIGRIFDANFLKFGYESTAYNIGKITGFLFKLVLGVAGLIILLRRSDKVLL